MAKKTYRDERVEHLSKYAVNMPTRGIYNKKVYDHILKGDNQRDLVCKYNVLEGVECDLLTKKLHRLAHHLNSSQILCYNFFRPMISNSGEATKELVSFLDKQGIKIELGSKCTFEYNDGGGDDTEFDFHVKSSDVEVYFEIKYTEQGFGRAYNDNRHREKFENIYNLKLIPKEKCLNEKPSYEEFIRNYQLYRNIIRVTDKNKIVVLMYPKDNILTNNQAQNFINHKISKEYKSNVRILHWENIVDKNTELHRKYFE